MSCVECVHSSFKFFLTANTTTHQATMRVFATKAQRFFLATATFSTTSHLALFSATTSAFTPRTSFSFRSSATIMSLLPSSSSSSSSSTKRFLSSSGGNQHAANIKHIGKEQMKLILQDYENDNVDNYCVIDVRTDSEVMATGKLSPKVHTLPVQIIMQSQAFSMSDDDFLDNFGFDKPSLDACIVFTCAAGIRSVYACQAAATQAGYSSLINYAGGANEWFS